MENIVKVAQNKQVALKFSLGLAEVCVILSDVRHLFHKRKWVCKIYLLSLSEMANTKDILQFLIQNDVPFNFLECKKAFDSLTPKEKLYAHYICRASWQGALICLLQTSPESPGIFLLFQKIFSAESVESFCAAAQQGKDGLSDIEIKSLIVYVASFYGNMGNYKSFGDTKFIPGLPKERFKFAITCSSAYKNEKETVENLCAAVLDDLYNLSNRRKQLGLEEQGLSTYYSSNCTREDVVLVQDFMKEKEISPYNTRLFKVEKDGNMEYELRLASVATSAEPLPGPNGQEDIVPSYLGEHVFKKNTVKVQRGDYSGIMEGMVQHLTEAEKYSANSDQSAMLKEYIHCFNTGSIEAHKNGSRHWIRDKGPVIESYIGFIESYRDPFGVRGEFEGFAAMVNKEMSKKFADLVDAATDLLPLLPWPKEYEKDKFLRPDFTSLDVLGFGSSGVPAGINIPNYDDIRQKEGFKNVSLGNVLASRSNNEKVTFVAEEYQELFSKLKAPSFEVQVGLHELLGHGSGKLFQLNEDGTFNFDQKIVIPGTENVVNSWYKPGETWDIVFQEIASTYEECRAECVGLYLCLNNKVLSIFGHEGEDGENISYINWLNMVRAGLIALEFYTPENKKWRQAHMQARYVILQVLLEAGEDMVTIKEIEDKDGKGNLLIQLDKEKIQTVGRDAIGRFLKKLQIYKSTADYDQGKKMYDGYSSVSEKFLELRELVLARKQPRRMLVQANTKLQDDNVVLYEYPASAAGMITSFTDRYPSHDAVLEKLWQKEASYHEYN